MAALVASLHMTTQCSRPTDEEITHDPLLLRRERTSLGLEKLRAEAPEDIGHF
jgi:hypothetical protein